MNKLLRGLFSLAVLAVPATSLAVFPDVQIDSPIYSSTVYLQKEGTMNGYKDGSFRPTKKLNRAEALKIIVTGKEKKAPTASGSSFSDVASDAWFAPYVEYGVQKGITSGDGKTGNFLPSKEVNKAEFLKMLLVAFEVDPKSFNLQSTANDLPADAWFTPYIQFAIDFKIVVPDANGNIYPQAPIDRGQAAYILFKLQEVGSGLSPQTLLDLTQEHLIISLQKISASDQNALSVASQNIAIAENFANIAIRLKPNDPTVQASVKTTLSAKNLIGAYILYQQGNIQGGIDAAKEAWKFADEAQVLNPVQTDLSTQIKKHCETIAQEARELKSQIEASQ